MFVWLGLQRDYFLLAITFLTRLPVPAVKNYSEEKLNQCRRYFSLVGVIVGSLCAITLYAAGMFVAFPVAALLSIIISLLITGAFHEDGLADTADGLGGGWSVEQKLTIMKDSRIGTYGSAALWCNLSLKFILISELAAINLFQTAIALISVHSVSRAVSSVLVTRLPYVRTSNNKPVVEFVHHRDTLIALGIALLALIPFYQEAIFLIPVLIIFIISWHYLLKKQIGGYTGDTLGAAQQIAELLCYLTLLILWNQALWI